MANSVPLRQMSKMLRLELVGLVLLAFTQILTEHRDFYGPYNQYGHQRYPQDWNVERTKEVEVEQGRLRGMVVRPMTNPRLPLVDVFLGVPYADPPVGSLRFTPPKSPQPWWPRVKEATRFAPVCPQQPPDHRLEVQPTRHEYLNMLLPYLRNQSEDCLYLNVYAPHQNHGPSNPRRYPVMVFIQGESFDWNSGNPYDGTVISAYGKVIFVTINFRLGILGFLRPGTSDNTPSNFGLLDQTAALVWLRKNVDKFGGDPYSMTVAGHGTGAIFANLLLISPLASSDDGGGGKATAAGQEGLFKRAILMSGSALSSDAIGKGPLQVTLQVAYALNCQTNNDTALAICLREVDVDSLLNVKIDKPQYVPAYAPLIDNAVIKGEPLKQMENMQLFGSFDLMYGVTESEKDHLLPPTDILDGMLDQEKIAILEAHAEATHQFEPKLAARWILEHYTDYDHDYTGNSTMKNRDLVLAAMSDSGTLAPLMRVADLHVRANPKSYMYVFSHPTSVQDYTGERHQTVHSEEIPYILGTPLRTNGYQLRGRYSFAEILFSEAMMTWWCNFAYTGNPNTPRPPSYMTDGPKERMQYDIDWPEYNSWNRTYLNLTTPPRVGTNYRVSELQFWNEDLPNVIRHLPTRPSILNNPETVEKHPAENSFGFRHQPSNDVPIPQDNFRPPPLSKKPIASEKNDTSTTMENGVMHGSSAVTMVIGLFAVFLLINVTAFFYFCHKRHSLDTKEQKLRNRCANEKNDGGSRSSKATKTLKHHQHQTDNVVEMSQKCESKVDLNEVIKNDKAYDNNSNFGRRSKLSRHNSSSTIDTHIKVKEWIQQEIVHRCSPRFLRKTRETLQKEYQEKLTMQQQLEEDEDRRMIEEERLNNKKPEPIYEQSPTLVVRPGKKPKLPKVSVAIDATPAMRTESILNQIPIELAKDLEMMNELGDYDVEADKIRTAPQVVVIEHHHSRSDPLPMENVFKSVKPNFSATRIYESDSGSASSLYAKINPKLKSRLIRHGQTVMPEGKNADTKECATTPEEDIYGKAMPKLRTFASNDQSADINVTCREPIRERDVISPEEALKTIRRRNYPKVLPDIEKRRSLPAPNSLLLPKFYGTLSKDHRHGPDASIGGHPPPPPPRAFGISKSLDLAEEVEEREPITTNLHVGPLLKRQDSINKNNSDSNLIDSLERVAIDAQEVLSNHRTEYGDDTRSGGISANPKCPLHGAPYLYSPASVTVETSTSQSVDCLDRNIGNPNWYRIKDSSAPSKGIPNSSLPDIVGNPNWYKPSASAKVSGKEALPEAQNMSRGNSNTDKPIQSNEIKSPGEPKIVITPRVGNLLGQSGQNLSQAVTGMTAQKDISQDPRIVITPVSASDRLPTTNNGKTIDGPSIPTIDQKILHGTSHQGRVAGLAAPSTDNRHEPTSNIKQPKIIIKPTTSVQRCRDQRYIPKVSAIPSPEIQNYHNMEKDTKGPPNPMDAILRLEKPPVREKPKVSRIPSFSRRNDECPGSSEKQSVYQEKTEIVQRVDAVPTSKVTTIPLNVEKSNVGLSSVTKKHSDSSASTTNSSSSNTNTIKRKPSNKK